MIGRVLGCLGHTAVRAGQLNEATDLCAQGLTLRLAMGHRPGILASLRAAMSRTLALGRPVVAAWLLGAAEAAREALSRSRTPIAARAMESIMASLRAQLGAAQVVGRGAPARHEPRTGAAYARHGT